MNAGIRRKLAMAARVRDFVRAHGGGDSSFEKLLGSLEERLARAESLALQQRDGLVGQHAAIVRRQELRRRMEEHLLPSLVRVGGQVAKGVPELVDRFRKASTKGPHRSFLTAAKGMLRRAGIVGHPPVELEVRVTARSALSLA